MKKVLLLGDSIRMGYDEYVQMAFDGIAEIYYPNDNGRFAAYTLRALTIWKNDHQWPTDFDLIHWNVGLWDCLTQLDGKELTQLSVYQSYLPRIHAALQRLWPNAKQVFATSTAVQEHLFGILTRKNCVTEEYNRAAVEALEPLGVGINDLYNLTRQFPESYFSDSTHLNTKEGMEPVVNQVIARIERELGLTAKKLDFDKLFAKETDIIGI